MAKLLIADDDKQMLAVLSDWLQADKYTVEAVNNGDEALFRLRTYDYDLVILDWEMGTTSGIDVCKQFRAAGGNTPIIMLTGRSNLDDKLQGLDTGADDYVTKPFKMEELSARVRAILRRPQTVKPNTYTFGDLQIDLNAKQLTKSNEPINLQPREFELLAFFAEHSGEVFSAETLIARIWSSDSETSPDAIRVHIAKIRNKLGNPNIIKTIHGVGYRFDP